MKVASLAKMQINSFSSAVISGYQQGVPIEAYSLLNIVIVIISIIYITVVVFYIARLFTGFFQLSVIVNKSDSCLVSGKTISFTNYNYQPFSFFNKIIISKKIKDHPGLNLILEHESIHTKQLHSIDLVLCEISKSLLWFSPFSRMLDRYLKANLEYITDREILEKQVASEQDYQLTLLNIAFDVIPSANFVNSFNNNQLLKRFNMMKKIKHPKRNNITGWLIVPLLAGMTLAFCSKETETRGEITLQNNEMNIRRADGSSDKPIYYVDGKKFDGEINEIDVNDIEFIQVMKSDEAYKFDKTEEARERGVVLIKTKSAAAEGLDWPPSDFQMEKPMDDVEVEGYQIKPE